MLLKHGADPEARDFWGQSAFDIASAKDEEFGSWLETFLRGENWTRRA